MVYLAWIARAWAHSRAFNFIHKPQIQSKRVCSCMYGYCDVKRKTMKYMFIYSMNLVLLRNRASARNDDLNCDISILTWPMRVNYGHFRILVWCEFLIRNERFCMNFLILSSPDLIDWFIKDANKISRHVTWIRGCWCIFFRFYLIAEVVQFEFCIVTMTQPCWKCTHTHFEYARATFKPHQDDVHLCFIVVT